MKAALLLLMHNVGKIILSVFFLFSFYILCLNHVDVGEIGIARNFITGNMWLQEEPRWYLTSPVTRVARINTKPIRVSVPTAGHGFSSKLVQFDKRGWQEFVATEGFHYYWWYNRFSINFGYREEHRGMKDILRGYAYGAKRYPFITIAEEYESK